MDAAELAAVGVAADPATQVLRLATACADAGLDGVVCSPLEIGPLRTALGREFVLVTPGIRSPGDAPDDQRRTLAPAAALDAGADYLVIGRPISAAAEPMRAAQLILDEISAALEQRS
jgi:orotidine-5'-phosphate decarboxylase